MARIPRVMVDTDWLQAARAGEPPGRFTPPFSADQVHRLTNVLRLQPGDLVEVFANGSGAFRGGLAADGTTWRLVALSPVAAANALNSEQDAAGSAGHSGPPVTIACGWPRARRADFLIEKLVELGVARLQPVVFTRSARGETFGAAKLDRYRRLIAKACEQSRRNRPMELAAPVTLAELLASAAPGVIGFVATAAGDKTARPLASALQMDLAKTPTDPPAAQSLLLLVGPEGGLTGEEIAAAVQAGYRPVTLGSLTLRVETAAVACAVLAANRV